MVVHSGGIFKRSDIPHKLAVLWSLQSEPAALVYVARRHGEGTPRPGYINVVVEAARDWALPESYICSLRRWSPSRLSGARPKESGEFG